MWEQLSAGGCSAVDARRYATPILASDLADLYSKALEARLTGVYHITGAERTNQYRFAAEVAVAFGLTGRQVNLVAPEVASRAYVDETSLNTRAIRRVLETPLPMLREGLVRWATEAILGRRRTRCQLSGRPRWVPCTMLPAAANWLRFRPIVRFRATIDFERRNRYDRKITTCVGAAFPQVLYFVELTAVFHHSSGRPSHSRRARRRDADHGHHRLVTERRRFAANHRGCRQYCLGLCVWRSF